MSKEKMKLVRISATDWLYMPQRDFENKFRRVANPDWPQEGDERIDWVKEIGTWKKRGKRKLKKDLLDMTVENYSNLVSFLGSGRDATLSEVMACLGEGTKAVILA